MHLTIKEKLKEMRETWIFLTKTVLRCLNMNAYLRYTRCQRQKYRSIASICMIAIATRGVATLTGVVLGFRRDYASCRWFPPSSLRMRNAQRAILSERISQERRAGGIDTQRNSAPVVVMRAQLREHRRVCRAAKNVWYVHWSIR